MTVVEEQQSYEAEKYKELWLEAKKRNSDLSATIDDLRRQIKQEQVAAQVAQESASEVDTISSERDGARAEVEVLRNENKSLVNRLKRAETNTEVAKKAADARADSEKRAVENAASEVGALREQVEELASSAEEAHKEKEAADERFKKAEKQIAAAQKIAEGIAELSAESQ